MCELASRNLLFPIHLQSFAPIEKCISRPLNRSLGNSIILTVAFLALASATCHAQEIEGPSKRFAVRLNTLGLLNLDGIGDIEYTISNRIGVFLGGGSEHVQPVFDRPNSWFKKTSGNFASIQIGESMPGCASPSPSGNSRGLLSGPTCSSSVST
jgi:hypothetical protein